MKGSLVGVNLNVVFDVIGSVFKLKSTKLLISDPVKPAPELIKFDFSKIKF